MLDNAYRQDIVTRIYVSGLNYNVNSSKRSISHNYAAEFLRFGIFSPQISDSVAPPTDGTANCFVRCKVRLIL